MKKIVKKNSSRFFKGDPRLKEFRQRPDYGKKIGEGLRKSKKFQSMMRSEERKRKTSLRFKGIKKSDIFRENVRRGHLGLKQTAEHIKNRVMSRKRNVVGWWNNPKEVKAKIGKATVRYLPLLKRKDTYPERLYEQKNFIENDYILGEDYLKQVPLCGATVADFYVIKENIAIFIDGCYWHGCPIHFPNLSNFNALREKDERITKILIDNGYKVERIWEHEIRNKK